jgi:phosphoglycolate phosphatase
VEEPYIADYTAHSAVDTKPFPGVIDTLQGLTESGWKLAVCTNKPVAPTHAILAALGLAPFISAIGGGDSFAARKPDPRHLLGTLELAGGSVDAAVMGLWAAVDGRRSGGRGGAVQRFAGNCRESA